MESFLTTENFLVTLNLSIMYSSEKVTLVYKTLGSVRVEMGQALHDYF